VIVTEEEAEPQVVADSASELAAGASAAGEKVLARSLQTLE